MFDYYELKFIFHGADCKRRAADMDEARAAKKELQAAGVKEITIFGVKKGTKEIQAAKKAYVKPEFKHEPATKAAKTPKAKKAPATKKKAAKATKKQKDKISKMSADDLRAIDSVFSHDGKIKILKTNTPKREPAGQLDLFTNWQRKPDNNTWDFTKDEIKIINDALGYYTLNSKNRVYLDSDFKKPENIVFDGLTNAFYEMAKNGNDQIILNNDDLRALVNVMGNYYRIKNDNSKYDANKLFMMFNSNIGD